MGMTHIVDRRLNGKNKSAVNRERFLRRYRHHIKKAVSDAVHRRSITDIERGERVSIPTRDIDEPVFHHGQGGHREMVHPGNRDFVAGDRLPKPEGGDGQGQGQGQASPDGEGMDEFAFQITQDEFLNFLFDDLELPNLVRKKLKDTETFNYVRSGFSTQGVPAKLDVVRSLRGAHARRLGLGGARKKKIRELEAQLADLKSAPADLDAAFSHEDQIKVLEDEIARLKANVKRIPFIDEIDLRYRQHLKQPKPATSAVMFCLMDVSGSMTQMHKDTAKRFFILLYLFLKKNYKKIDVVFIRHHTSAKEVDEEEFFYSRETGGTIVSSALKLMHKIIESRYSPAEWNIYAAQASDGDNWNDDSPVCGKLLTDSILPLVQYFAYVEITPQDHQMLWHEYERVQERFPESFAQQQIADPGEIYPVFRRLFERKAA
ncbi:MULTISPECIES: YeaH/YhbH family protein [unclassified Marinobacter]|uniref:YeaH/YhbH family protein n=1 Tax=unclassified Marinobacter TaxID=83889 RepID=UPI0026E3D855|nr:MULTISPECIES: YeaH/YhbH family protein [unclassified Marinobacter]MDO6442962.1 YeaH/YhbH family protein [Marinobacter sp. 2_MG-2023]MDO6822824.1 YeaH/YhbH family protein [Marinobacter sp. 1_MG-2023]